MTETADRATLRDDRSTPALSGDELSAFKRSFDANGYLVFRDVVPKDRLEALRQRVLEEFERQKRSGELFAGGGSLTGHLNCFPGEGSRFIYETLRERGIIDVVRAVFPKAVGEPNVGCNLNLPNSVVQHYHVDSNYFTEDFVIVNTAVVDTDLTNGAIDVIPGTHRKYYKFWRFAVERPSRAAIRIPMKQGDVLVRTSNLWHRGMPNHASVARPMVAFTWEDGGSRNGDPFAIEEGRIRFFPNWYRTNLLGRLRERTYLAAPITYDAYRFVRSLVGNKGYRRQTGA
jgi:hypothetical protein